MTQRKSRGLKLSDPRQLDLFGEQLETDDPVAAYYRRLRKIGATLTLNLAEKGIYVISAGSGLPHWAVRDLRLFRDRVHADLLRVEHGVEPAPMTEQLAGGATLHRLPNHRAQQRLDPPVRRPAPPRHSLGA